MLNDGRPVPLQKIPRLAYVQVAENRWRRLQSWVVLDPNPRVPDAPRFQVSWVGTELYPDTYPKEPSWPVWVGDAPPRTEGSA
jgi:hypothetical protein